MRFDLGTTWIRWLSLRYPLSQRCNLQKIWWIYQWCDVNWSICWASSVEFKWNCIFTKKQRPESGQMRVCQN